MLENGRIADQGTHDELVERSPLYADIAARGLPDPELITRAEMGREAAGL